MVPVDHYMVKAGKTGRCGLKQAPAPADTTGYRLQRKTLLPADLITMNWPMLYFHKQIVQPLDVHFQMQQK